QLQRALRIEALSPGWRGSFEALLRNPTSGNAGLTPDVAAHPPAPGFRRLRVAAIDREAADILSVTMRSPDAKRLSEALPGQYVVVKLQPVAGSAPIFRSYSLSGAASRDTYRISVKIEPRGAEGTWLRDHLRVEDILDVSSPRGSFVLQPGARPVVL